MADFNGGVADFEDELWWSLSLLMLLDEELLFNFGILPGTSWKKSIMFYLLAINRGKFQYLEIRQQSS